MKNKESLEAVHTHTHTHTHTGSLADKTKSNKIKIVLIIFIVILALVLCFNVGVYAAYALAATEVSYTKSDGTTVSVKDALDELNKKVPTKSIGDEVTVGGEQFYVLEWDNNCDTVNLISKYNLNTTETAQQNAAYGTTACTFSSRNYWGSSFTSSPFNLNDFMGDIATDATDAIRKAKSYGRSKGAVSSRLLSYEEANALNAKKYSNTKIDAMYRGTANTANGYLRYWLGSANRTDYVWSVYGSDGHLYGSYFNFSGGSGVRPVITVLKSKIS